MIGGIQHDANKGKNSIKKDYKKGNPSKYFSFLNNKNYGKNQSSESREAYKFTENNNTSWPTKNIEKNKLNTRIQSNP